MVTPLNGGGTEALARRGQQPERQWRSSTICKEGKTAPSTRRQGKAAPHTKREEKTTPLTKREGKSSTTQTVERQREGTPLYFTSPLVTGTSINKNNSRYFTYINFHFIWFPKCERWFHPKEEYESSTTQKGWEEGGTTKGKTEKETTPTKEEGEVATPKRWKKRSNITETTTCSELAQWCHFFEKQRPKKIAMSGLLGERVVCVCGKSVVLFLSANCSTWRSHKMQHGCQWPSLCGRLCVGTQAVSMRCRVAEENPDNTCFYNESLLIRFIILFVSSLLLFPLFVIVVSCCYLEGRGLLSLCR